MCTDPEKQLPFGQEEEVIRLMDNCQKLIHEIREDLEDLISDIDAILAAVEDEM